MVYKIESKLLICWLFLNALLLNIFNYQFIRTLILKTSFTSQEFLEKKDNIQYLTIQHIYQEIRKHHQFFPKTQASLPEPSQTPPIFSSKHINNNISLDLNISSYYINHLSYSYIPPITQPTIHLGINEHYISTVKERAKW